jgi:ABC-2 type transport system permease protein
MFCLGYGSADISSVFAMMFFVLMVFVPLLTMRLFSEEQKLGTDRLLLTSPVNLGGLVLGKFFAALIVFALSTLVLPFYGVMLSIFTEVNWASVWGNYVGLLLLGAVYIAIGMLVSSLTENQMIAAVGGFFLNLVTFILTPLSDAVSDSSLPLGFLANALKYLSVYDRFTEFTLGIFDFANILFFISFAAVFLFLTVRSVDGRRW